MRAAINAWWMNRTLVGKFALILGLCTLALGPITYLVLRLMLTPTFEAIEAKALADQTRRVRHSLTVYEQTLANNVSDYAIWDDAYRYIETGDRTFEAETLLPDAYVNMGIDLSGYVTTNGVVRWSKSVDRKTFRYLDEESRHFGVYLSRGDFFERARKRERYSDFTKTPRGLFQISSQQVLRSDGSGPVPGFVAMGVLVDSRSLSEVLQVDVDLDLAAARSERQAIAAAADRTLVAETRDASKIRIGLVDQRGEVVAVIRFELARSAAQAGRGAIVLAAFGVTVVALLLIVIVTIAIRWIAVSRLQRLEAHVRTMRQETLDLPEDLLAGRDEICRLARQFSALDEELDAAEAELERSSYLQGRADSAAGMLHNVRNSMAHLRVVQQHWLEQEGQPFRLNMERALTELGDEACPPDRRIALEAFLVSAARDITAAAPQRRQQLEEAKHTLDTICEILGSFDYDTSGKRAQESVALRDVVAQQAKTVLAQRWPGLVVTIADDLPTVRANRLQLGQIVGNLLVNAAEAISAAAPEQGGIDVDWARVSETEIELRIRDNGDGIAAENLSRVFERGFSTRSNKTGGLGMHWSSITAQAMGGALSLDSEGAGKGAVARLRLQAATAVTSERRAA